MNKFKYFFLFLFLTSLLFTGFIVLRINNNDQKIKRTQSAVEISVFSPIPLPRSTPTPIPTPHFSLKKSSYTIALFGDSMIDIMGEKVEILQKILSNKYPSTEFTLYNYGIGGQNIEQGLARFENAFINKERSFPPLTAISPDVLIIGSFAYNPFSPHDKNKHYVLLRELVNKAKKVSSRVYLLAEIAPLEMGFGKGKNGVNMPEEAAQAHAEQIIEQLDNVINLSTTENIPLINVYYLSRINGSYGDPYFVNKDDGIHPSYAGNVFTSELIVKNIGLD